MVCALYTAIYVPTYPVFIIFPRLSHVCALFRHHGPAPVDGWRLSNARNDDNITCSFVLLFLAVVVWSAFLFFHQENGYDCGVFAALYASCINDGTPFDFCQADIGQIRRRMAWSLLHQRLV